MRGYKAPEAKYSYPTRGIAAFGETQPSSEKQTMLFEDLAGTVPGPSDDECH